MVARTDAQALHDLLVKVRASAENHLQTAWAEALDSQFGSAEFARRHAEVVSMLSESLRDIQALPERTRTRYEQYTHAWWMAVVGAQWQWGAQMDTSTILSDDHLNLLDAAADAIEHRLGETAAAPRALELGPLREQCEDWLELLDATELPAALKVALTEDLQHVLWLIDNAGMFGVARIARAGQAALGAIALASPQVPEPDKASWKTKANNFAGALLVLTYLSEAVRQAIESGQHLINVLG